MTSRLYRSVSYDISLISYKAIWIENKTEREKMHGRAVGQMEMQCSRLIEKRFGVTRLMRREGAHGMALAGKGDLARGSRAALRNLCSVC